MGLRNCVALISLDGLDGLDGFLGCDLELNRRSLKPHSVNWRSLILAEQREAMSTAEGVNPRSGKQAFRPSTGAAVN